MREKGKDLIAAVEQKLSGNREGILEREVR
jgi:hypothetical protein